MTFFADFLIGALSIVVIGVIVVVIGIEKDDKRRISGR